MCARARASKQSARYDHRYLFQLCKRLGQSEHDAARYFAMETAVCCNGYVMQCALLANDDRGDRHVDDVGRQCCRQLVVDCKW
jgi:hypothetical protein